MNYGDKWLGKFGGGFSASVIGGGSAYQANVNSFIPGFGHRFHKPADPRAPALLGQQRCSRGRLR